MKLKINIKMCRNIIVLLLVLLLFVLFFLFLSKYEKESQSDNENRYDTPDDDRLLYNGKWYVPDDDLDVILFLGVDKFVSAGQHESYNNNQQTDFIMLMLLNRKKGTYSLIHINRDTMANIPVLDIHGESAGTVFAQLALAHTYGTGKLDSCRNAAKAVSELLYGIKIDHYVSFTMDTVAAVNDMVGGVTVTITDDMTSVSPQMYKGATVTLQGDMALSYVRARGSLADSSNLKRMERQRLYVKELVGKLSEKIKTDEYFLRELFNGVSSYITSDCTVNQIIRLSEGWEELIDWELKTIDGEAIVGDEFMEFYPNEEALKELVLDSFYVPLDE